MKKASICRAFALASLLTFAAVPTFAADSNEMSDFAQFAKTYAFPISSLEKVEQAMQTAAARTGTDKTTDVVYVVDTNQGSSVHCAAGNPAPVDGGLYGCTLNFVVDIGGGATLTARKMLFLTQTSQQAKDILAKADPNQTARVDLKTPFDDGHGSTYYCDAEGSAGAKSYVCYLNVID